MAKDQDKPQGQMAVEPPATAPQPRAAAAKAPEAAPPAAGLPRFRVSLNGESMEVQARDEREAWALFCDSRRSWPGPKSPGRKVEAL